MAHFVAGSTNGSTNGVHNFGGTDNCRFITCPRVKTPWSTAAACASGHPTVSQIAPYVPRAVYIHSWLVTANRSFNVTISGVPALPVRSLVYASKHRAQTFRDYGSAW
jgi:hypothetical protein